jgi:8-oxo-dGTP diphosphatase
VSEPLRCAGAVIVNDDARIFIQRRSPQRRLFPDTWDIVGGHVEPDETLDDTLRREVYEETGWELSHVLGVVGEHAYRGNDGLDRVETDFLVRVDGDTSRPRLEAGKHTEFRWIGPAEVSVLDENRGIDDGMMRRIVEDAFALMREIGL